MCFYSILHNWSYVNLRSMNVHVLIFVKVRLQSNGNAVSHLVSINLKIASKDTQSRKKTINFACTHNLWAQTPDELIRLLFFLNLWDVFCSYIYTYLNKWLPFSAQPAESASSQRQLQLHTEVRGSSQSCWAQLRVSGQSKHIVSRMLVCVQFSHLHVSCGNICGGNTGKTC